MKKGWIIYGLIIGAAVLIGGAILYFVLNNQSHSSTNQATTNTTNNTTPAANNQTTSAVNITNMAFSPGTITVKKGDTVTWSNNDSAAHTVTANDNSFISGNLAKGQTFSHTFNTAGTFSYHCAIHPGMKGTVIVQ